MRFYALHKFNTLVERGEFDYANLPKLYAIAFLEKSILPTAHYHTVANLRSESGEIIDHQMTFILMALAKFDKPVCKHGPGSGRRRRKHGDFPKPSTHELNGVSMGQW